MAKRTGTPKLQEDIQTDEDLKVFIDRPGLLVLDIYSDWCGPCLGMVPNLRKTKMEIGGDLLNFATCKADTISLFSRFRRKSEPTWLFVTNKKAVNIMFGANVPNLTALIAQELRFLTLKTRNYYELDEYQPIEQARRKVKEDALNAIISQEREEAERKRISYLNYVTDTIMESLPDMGVTLFAPHVTRDMLKKSIQIAEQLKMQCKDRSAIEISIKDFETIHYACPNPIPDEILEQFDKKELFVCFWKVLGTGNEVPKLLHDMANELQSQRKQTIMEDDLPKEYTMPPIITPIDLKLEIELRDDESSESSERSEGEISKASSKQLSQEEQEHDEQEGSVEEEEDEAAEELPPANLDFDLNMDEEAEEGIGIEQPPKRRIRIKKIRIPPIWVPDNHRTHAALIYKYFRTQTNAFLPPDPEPEPPYVIMAFDSYKKRDLILHCERHKDQVPMYGFFTSDESDEAKFIANSLEKYKPETANDKIVLKVKKVTSHHMLELVTYGPSYVSPNITVAKDEVMKFFPPTYKTADQEAEEEAEKEKDKTDAKKSKGTAPTHAPAAAPAATPTSAPAPEPTPAPTVPPAPAPEVTETPANVQQTTEVTNPTVNTEEPAVAA